MTLSPTKNKGPLYKRRLMATKMNEGKCKKVQHNKIKYIYLF